MTEVPSADYVWKLPPEENGGLLARTFDELLGHLDRSLQDPTCCRDLARRFIERHMAPVDGHTCERIADAIAELAVPAGVD